MFIKYKTLLGKQSCLKTKKVSTEITHFGLSITFICNDTWSKIAVPIEDLISIGESPDMPRIAFVPKGVWLHQINNKPKFKDIDIRWHEDYLYCWEKDCSLIAKLLKEFANDDIIISELPLEEYEKNR